MTRSWIEPTIYPRRFTALNASTWADHYTTVTVLLVITNISLILVSLEYVGKQKMHYIFHNSYLLFKYKGVGVVEWSRALDVRLSEWCCSVSMVGVQIPSREEQKFYSSRPLDHIKHKVT